MKVNTNSVRGTRDILPAEQEVRQYVKDVILKTYSSYGFNQIKTPILEDISLLTKGDSGDNTKLMFKVLKRGEKLDIQNAQTQNDLCDMGLRYDLTVPLARFYSNNQNNLPMPFKSVQIDEAFRAERPQKGRLRQFTQCDIDILGDENVNADIEVLYVSAKTLLNLGFKNFTYRISDRRILNSLIESCGFKAVDCQDICITLDKLDKIAIDGIKQELLDKAYNIENIEKLINALADIQQNSLNALNNYDINSSAVENVKQIVQSLGALSNNQFNVVFDISIVRGQGYYTSSVFEVYLDGYNGACGGGGRYDNMIAGITGVKTCAVGFSIGFERICMLLLEQNKQYNKKAKLVHLYNAENNIVEVYNKTNTLLETYDVLTVKKQKNLFNQLEKLSALGYTHYVFFDGQEIKQMNK